MAQVVEIRSLEAQEVAPYRQLTGRQLQQSHLFIAESENVILAALDAGCRPLSLLMERQHITGKGNLDESLLTLPGYKQFEFISEELPAIFACADYVLSRAGSNALCEFQALKKPMLLVPYPKGASRGDQILNAASYEKRGLCHVLDQADMTAETLFSAIEKLMAEKDTLIRHLEEAPPADGTKAVLKMIEEAVKK